MMTTCISNYHVQIMILRRISTYNLHVFETEYERDHPKIVNTISYLENRMYKRQVMLTLSTQIA